MADRSISIAIEAKVSGFVAGMKTAQQAANDFGSRTAAFARENEQHLDRVGKASMVMGGALLAGAALAVKSFMEFDSAMSEVQASTHESAANMELLRTAAIDAGADTAFSAKEAAQGIDELAKAGVSTKDILGGGLKGALSLAAAGSLEVAEAAEISASALTQFKLSGDKVPHLADLLAAGAGKAQGSVHDLGMALNQTGLVASSTGLTIEETTGGLAAFASAGLVGSDAGTSMKTMLQRLTPQSKEAAEKMAELGISAYDSSGNFIGLSKFAENLKTSMADLTPEARNAAMGIIFGSDAVRAANVLFEQGGKGIADWTDKVNDAGFAAVTAAIKQDNLAGDLEKLGGSFDSVLIKGGSGAAQALRGIVQGAEDLVDAIGKIPTPILNAGVGIAGVAGGAALLAGAVMTAVPKLLEFHESFNKIAPAGTKAGTAIRNVGKAAGVAAGVLVGLQVAAAVFSEKNIKSAEDYGQAILKVARAGKDANSSGLDSIFTKMDKFGGQNITNIDNMADAVARLTHQNFNDSGNKFFEGFTNFLGLPKGEIGQLEERLRGLGDSMGDLTRNGSADVAAKSFQALTKEFERNGQGAKEALDSVPGYKDALQALANQAGATVEGQDLLDFAMGKVPESMQGASSAVQTYTSVTGEAKPVTEAMADALAEVGLSAQGAIIDVEAFGKSLFNAGLLSLSASDAAIGYQDAIDKMTESVKKNGTNLDINTEAGRANQSAFNSLAQAAIASAEATATETLATQGSKAAQDSLQGSLRTSYDDLVRAAGQLGITGDAADTMARKALGIPKTVNIDAWIADHASTTLDGIKGKADAIDGRHVSMLIETIEKTVKTSEYRDDPSMVALDPATHADGGMVNYLASGGRPRLYDMRPRGTDTVPAMLTPGEIVMRKQSVDSIGAANLLWANQTGRLPFQYAPAPAPPRQVASVVAGTTTVAAPAVTVMIGNEQLDSRMFRVASSAVGVADSNSQYVRAGR